MPSRTASRLLITVAAAGFASASLAQDNYPSRPIELILPSTTGGLVDGVARMVSEEIRKALGATIVVRNMSGGSGVIAAQAVASAKPDGYTIGWAQGSQLTMVPHFVKTQFTVDDFDPVTLMYQGPMLLSVTEGVPANNLAELADYVKKDGNPLPVGVSAQGGLAHLTAELFTISSGVPTEAIPYRGETPIILDMLGNNVPAAMTTWNAVQSYTDEGKIKVLATSSAERIPALPDVPTFKEMGYPEVVTTWWHGIVVPKGTPQPIIEKLNTALTNALQAENVRKLLTEDIEIVNSTPEAFGAVIRKDYDDWGKLIEERGIKQQ